jgi:hypothetical protein
MIRLALALTRTLGVASPLVGQGNSADEKAIWALIQNPDGRGSLETDSITFVSGAYPRPIIGKRVSTHSGTAGAHQAVQRRSNVKRTVRPQRVVASKGGDMAYGFAYFAMEFDRPDGTGKTEHMKFEGTNLTVWRKIDGKWRQGQLQPPE